MRTCVLVAHDSQYIAYLTVCLLRVGVGTTFRQRKEVRWFPVANSLARSPGLVLMYLQEILLGVPGNRSKALHGATERCVSC